MAVTAAGGVILGIVAVVMSLDAPGRVLASIAAVGLLVLAALGGLRRPRLAVVYENGRPQLAVRGLAGTTAFASEQITRVRLSKNRRLGRTNPMLEIDVSVDDDGDAAERLLVFTRWDLGTNPADVYDALTLSGLVP